MMFDELEMMMNVLVMKTDGNNELFRDAEFHLFPNDGVLYVSRGEKHVGIFAAGCWAGVREMEPAQAQAKAPAKAISVTSPKTQTYTS